MQNSNNVVSQMSSSSLNGAGGTIGSNMNNQNASGRYNAQNSYGSIPIHVSNR
jgi:hypothetical protein